MDNALIKRLKHLTTPHLADGCLRTGLPIRCAPSGLQAINRDMQCVGRARPVRHVGSIDVYFEAMEEAGEGDVLVVDNGGRLDEACVGDIVALEVQAAGVSGIVIWGLHRDSRELADIGFPLFSLGALPTGPQRLNPRPVDMFNRAMVGPHVITPQDFVVADANGVLFLPEDYLEKIVTAASTYRDIEARQLKGMAEGKSYRSQIRFSEYTARRKKDPSYGFRQHLKDIEAAGEV
jgi:regulator of RNase E activity RraA